MLDQRKKLKWSRYQNAVFAAVPMYSLRVRVVRSTSSLSLRLFQISIVFIASSTNIGCLPLSCALGCGAASVVELSPLVSAASLGAMIFSLLSSPLGRGVSISTSFWGFPFGIETVSEEGASSVTRAKGLGFPYMGRIGLGSGETPLRRCIDLPRTSPWGSVGLA